MITIRTLGGCPVTIVPDERAARVLMAGMEHHRATVDLGATHYFRGRPQGFADPHPVEVYAREQLEAEVAELAAAWKAGCNR